MRTFLGSEPSLNRLGFKVDARICFGLVCLFVFFKKMGLKNAFCLRKSSQM